ncbi:MAG: methyl-accepting chemotaxis protein [Negativicutes bacterium]|nr:methyl-accepting chemotaxis protein [Negativicutes bacterium]
MQWLADRKMAFKLISIILMGLIALGAVGYVGYYYLSESNTALNSMYDYRLVPVRLLNETRAHIISSNAAALELMLTTDDRKNQELKEIIDKRGKQISENFSIMEKMPLDRQSKELLSKVEASRQKYLVARDPIIALALLNKNEEAYALYTTQVDMLTNSYLGDIGNLSDYFSKISEQAIRDSNSAFQHAVMIVIGIIIAALLLISTVGWLITRVITRPLKALVITCEELAIGDFCDKPRRVLQKDEIGQLADALVKTRLNVHDLMEKINDASEQVAASSEELTSSAEQSAQAANQIAESITDVAAGAIEQLSAANETSAVVEQISASMQEVAANANQVASKSNQTAEKAIEGGKAVDMAITQMANVENTVNASAAVVTKLGDRSKEIGAIIDTIAGIAGQTNLLALNAAIEAARAGEQGRGFAVVAEEVRKLAEQSQDAAKKIAKLIGEIQGDTANAVIAMNDGTREVKTGAEVVNAAGSMFREIAELVSQVSSQIKEISAAIQEVSIGSQQIVNSVKKIDEVSKKSAAEAQTVSAASQEQAASMLEVAHASEALSRMAQDLQASVAKFCV